MSNWKKALEKFQVHEKSGMHLKSTQFWAEYRKTGETVLDQLSSAHTKKVTENRKYIKFIIQSILFLGKQTLPLRGHDEKKSSVNQGNFLELVKLRCSDKGEEFNALINSSVHSYLSPQIQNELIELIKNEIIREIVEVNSCSAFSIICDETKDISCREQLSICIRYAASDKKRVEIKERFLGFVEVPETTGEKLFLSIKGFLQNIGVNLSNFRGQAYDGASNMSGKFNGVAAKFKEIEPRALYTHCHAHLLDLAVMRFCEDVKELRNCLSIVNHMYNIICTSAKRFSIFEKICHEASDKFMRLVSLSRTRWTVRHRSLHSILEQLPEIIETLEEISNDTSNSKVAAEADGLIKLSTNFEFVFCLNLLYQILSITDILSKELQSECLDISKLFPKVEAVLDSLMNDRSEDGYHKMWNETEELCEKYCVKGLDISRASPERKRKIPKRFQDGTSENHQFTVEEKFKICIYYSALDKIIVNLKNRFSENDYSHIKSIFAILTSWDSIDESIVKKIQIFYKISPNLNAQLKFFHCYAQKNFSGNKSSVVTLQEVANFFYEHQLQNNAPAVLELLQIALSWPITTATAERSFSTLRRLKTYLRSTMQEDRLNGLAIMAIETEITTRMMENENLEKLVELFSNRTERRLLLK